MTIVTDTTIPVSWSRLIRFLTTQSDTVYGEPVDPKQDLGVALASGEVVVAHVLDAKVPWQQGVTRTGRVETVYKLLSPVPYETCGVIRAIGLNYKDHAAELGCEIPSVPTVFLKPPQALTHPNHPISIPLVAQNEEMDYEVELAIILGKDTKDVDEYEAMHHILGYTCANDLTARKHWKTSSQWGFCKGFDSFCPIGPCIVSSRALPNPQDLALQTRVNGQLMQDGSTNSMIFSIPRLVSYLSQGTTLPAGTIIITGTPPGIGDSYTPKVWLKHGDTVQCTISGGIGSLFNYVAYEGHVPLPKEGQTVMPRVALADGDGGTDGIRSMTLPGTRTRFREDGVDGSGIASNGHHGKTIGGNGSGCEWKFEAHDI